MLELFLLWQDFGEFPYPGTLLDQPAAMIDAFRIFQAELAAVCGPDKALTAWELVEILAAFYGKR
jgi:hypothetical protein